MRSTRVLLSAGFGLLSSAIFAWWLSSSLSASATQQGLRAIERGEVPAGIARLADGVEADPQNTWAWYHLGFGLLLVDQPAEAERALRMALGADPRNHGAMNNLAVALAQQGQPAEARDVLRRLVAFAPRFQQGQENLAQLYREMGEHALADRHDGLAREITRRWGPRGGVMARHSGIEEHDMGF